MSLFLKLFYKKPPEGLLEICERVYAFDCCFSKEAWAEQEYKVHIENVVEQFQEQFPESSILVFNFREGEERSQLAKLLSVYDITIMYYPRQYEGCPLPFLEVV
ncbi:hypothetical protein MLD38_006309 [Melastoma candidum]|uniref:Uncharacterized protein n=1 Tax=Melastoma candidum TaxID=119954 RepID=A0ACB9RPF4_9MYRT|nr:hypothetical protein MLD38_006309 [Melastoma candidum]